MARLHARWRAVAGCRETLPARAALVGTGVLVVALGLAGCGGDAHRAVPSTVPVPVEPPTTVPSVDTPLGARLAIGTAQGMELWSAATGVFTVGPSLHDVDVSDIAWSGDGRSLSWQTRPAGSRRSASELWYADVATGATMHWRRPAGAAAYVPVIVTAAGVLTLGRTVRTYSAHSGPDGTTAVIPAVVPPPGSTIESWDRGWIVEPHGSPTGQRLERIGANGATVPPGVVLDAATDHGPYFDLGTVDRSGGLFAAELGTHGTGCERSGTSQLWTATLSTGAVRYSTPPAPRHEETQRFWDVDVSGPPGTVYVAALDCATKGSHRGQVVSTELWRFHRGGWRRVGPNLVAADQAGGGPLATVSGTVRIDHGVAAVGGPGTVDVAGRAVATGGQVLAWDPVQDVPHAPATSSGHGQPGAAAIGGG